MSLGYAEKLSFIEDVGKVGMTEFFDSSHVLQEKIERLVKMIQKSKHLVVFTGAGISTSCGIPDFRGPKGIWTLQVKILNPISVRANLYLKHLPFHRAMPSITHMALVELEKAGILKFVISQDALPPKEMLPAEKHCRMADLLLCLGTSLQITPACNLPLKCLRGGGKMVIVNLQKTPKDKNASLVIHGFVDKVIAGVMDFLSIRIPPYVRIDLFQIIITRSLSADKKFVNWTLQVASVHALKAPLPFLKSIEVSFSDAQKYKAAILHEQPFNLKRRTVTTEAFEILLKLNFSDGCGCLCTQINIPFGFKLYIQITHSSIAALLFIRGLRKLYLAAVQGLNGCCNLDKDTVIQDLREKAIQDICCGQNAVIERILAPRTEFTVHAVVTSIKAFESESDSLNNDVKRATESINGTQTSQKRSKGRKRKSIF
ncbi:hypothetical protein GH714_006746 [Hevea brasiliensis]|uniref:protein acetyllysine N-acetyltransferase n=1 Tax=Hevea brasiliensis TaxID=3981 RepID=A0A6A6M0W2_HEVBR|nr:hypothetical protein GH714_006746 [Hevea brasiliensis]